MNPIRITYEDSVLRQLATLVMTGFARYPWGGVEAGGILFGTHASGGVHICAFRAVESEHHYGPSFELSEKDLETFDLALAAASSDEALRGIIPVGWYQSVSRRDLTLITADSALHKRSFPESWQIAVVLKRSKTDPVQFGFFTPGRGTLQGQSPFLKLSIDDLPAVAPSPKSRENRVEDGSPDRLATPGSPNAAVLGQVPQAKHAPAPTPARIDDISPVGQVISSANATNPVGQGISSPAKATNPVGPVISSPAKASPQTETGPALTPAPAPMLATTPELVTTPEPDHKPAPLHHEIFVRDPFAPAPDPEFFYASPQHKEALACLSYGIQERKGFILLLGDAGTGKTLVLECLIDYFRTASVEFALLANPRISSAELFELLAYDLGLTCETPSKTSVLIALNERLAARAQNGRITVLIVDNAHKLPLNVIEEIELLGNLENRSGKLLQVVFAGELGFERELERPELRGLRQRILLRARLGSFRRVEHTIEYVQARLTAGGRPHQTIFPREVLQEIHVRSGGIPRMINSLCSDLLALCSAREESIVSLEMIDEITTTLGITGH